MSDELEQLHNDISEHLEQISKLFLQRPKITIVIRNPWVMEGMNADVILTDDDFDLAIAAINKLRSQPPTTGLGAGSAV